MNRLWLSVPESVRFPVGMRRRCGSSHRRRTAVVVQVNLKFVHLVEGKYFYVLFQIIHCKEFAGHIQHKAAVREKRIIPCRPFGELSLFVVEYLQ